MNRGHNGRDVAVLMWLQSQRGWTTTARLLEELGAPVGETSESRARRIRRAFASLVRLGVVMKRRAGREAFGPGEPWWEFRAVPLDDALELLRDHLIHGDDAGREAA